MSRVNDVLADIQEDMDKNSKLKNAVEKRIAEHERKIKMIQPFCKTLEKYGCKLQVGLKKKTKKKGGK